MTKLCYPQGCEAGSKDRGVALSANSDNRWFVNFNHGNVNNNHRNNNGFVRAVRVASPGEYQGAEGPTFLDLYDAAINAGAGKVASNDQIRFETKLIDNIFALQQELKAGKWHPSKSTCFIAQSPKAREIHAPAYRDRVAHHALIPSLESVYLPRFIHDSYSNQVGKGTHAAVNRLKHFFRQQQSGDGGGFYLQLDIKNFFNSIHRPTLWKMLKSVMESQGTPWHIQRAIHALLRHPPLHYGVYYKATAKERAQVPLHKRLENSAPGCGLPIGNLSSQFFANVYLNALDQFVKHVLKVKRYVRYVDDFVLVHKDREQLVKWQAQIETYLHETLKLELKDDIKLKPLNQGCDFLGYVLYPTHTRVRRRVVQHYRERLQTWQQKHVESGRVIATPEQFRQIRAISASYEGHFAHADSRGLRDDFNQRFPWLAPMTQIKRRFDYRLAGRRISVSIPKSAKLAQRAS